MTTNEIELRRLWWGNYRLSVIFSEDVNIALYSDSLDVPISERRHILARSRRLIWYLINARIPTRQND